MQDFFGRFSRGSMVLVCAGFSLFVLAVCIVAGMQFKRGTEREFYRATENIAQVLLASFEEDAVNVDAILTQLAAQIPESDVSPAKENELHQLLTRYALQASMIGPGVIDRNGILAASARTVPIPKISLKERSVFRVHAENPNESQLYISAPMRGLLTNEWSIQFSRPLRNSTGGFYGVVIASYRLSHFIDLYEKLKISDRGLAGLTGMDGIVRIRSLSGSIGYGTAISKIAPVYERIRAGERSGTFYGRSTTDNVTRIGTFVASKITPFYVTVAYDEDYLRSQYIGFFYVLGLCWLVLTAAMAASVAYIRAVEKIKQRAQLEVVQSAVTERQKISADMHDSIGASLATLLAHFTSKNIDPAEVKRKIGEILMELRFLVDSAEPVDGELNLVLSNVRHRMASGIELAGIALRWQADELPKLENLTARDALAIRLILMEALSNIIHHSKAKTAALKAHYDGSTSMAIIEIRDDGCGFNLTDRAAVGRGISNMNKRVRAITVGATLAIETSPGHGTIIRIELKVPHVDPAALRGNTA
ncbi:MAG: cache domain-containing sensor histidine kinase [Pseudolabrys sp.]